jgi:hypothetical protein
MTVHKRHPQGDPNCEHPDEYRRVGNHPDVVGRWVHEDIDPACLYCLRCEREIGVATT